MGYLVDLLLLLKNLFQIVLEIYLCQLDCLNHSIDNLESLEGMGTFMVDCQECSTFIIDYLGV
jgi:hypothetical protein